MAGAFDVEPAALHSAAGKLRGHAGELTAAAAQGSGGASGAAGGAGQGPLAGALNRFASTLTDRTRAMAEVTRGVADGATSSAVCYVDVDAGAAALLGGGP